MNHCTLISYLISHPISPPTSPLHRPYIAPTSPLHRPYIAPTSPLHCPTSPLHRPYIATTSPLHRPYITPYITPKSPLTPPPTFHLISPVSCASRRFNRHLHARGEPYKGSWVFGHRSSICFLRAARSVAAGGGSNHKELLHGIGWTCICLQNY